MKSERILRSLSQVSEVYIEEAAPRAAAAKRRRRAAWGALAACLALCLTGALLLAQPSGGDEPTDDAGWADPGGDGDDGRVFTLGGETYIHSGKASGITDTLPEGFTHGGDMTLGGQECPYYVNPDVPEWVYIGREVTGTGEVDATGTIITTESYFGYVRYVDARLRGRDFLSLEGQLYISMWSAQPYGDDPDVDPAFYDRVEAAYDLTITGALPEGFVSVGTAEFTGFDTLPTGELACNGRIHGQETMEVFVHPENDEVVLVSVTSSPTRSVETPTYDVFIRYDKPLSFR